MFPSWSRYSIRSSCATTCCAGGSGAPLMPAFSAPWSLAAGLGAAALPFLPFFPFFLPLVDDAPVGCAALVVVVKSLYASYYYVLAKII